MQKAFGYGAVPAKADADDADDADAADDAALRDAPPTPEARDGDGEEVDAPSPRTILCLTMLGALDEVSYFPALLVGGVFTDSELACGTVLASAVVLTLITTCLAKSKPILNCMDAVPLYAVVGLFACILTAGAVLDAAD